MLFSEDKILEQRHLHFLADMSNKNYEVNFDKSVLPKSDLESNVQREYLFLRLFLKMY